MVDIMGEKSEKDALLIGRRPQSWKNERQVAGQELYL